MGDLGGPDPRVTPVTRDLRDQQVRDRLVIRAPKVLRDIQATPAQLERAQQVIPVTPDLRGQQVRDQLDILVPRVLLGTLVTLGHKDRLEWDLPGTPAIRGLRGQRGPQAILEHKE